MGPWVVNLVKTTSNKKYKWENWNYIWNEYLRVIRQSWFVTKLNFNAKLQTGDKQKGHQKCITSACCFLWAKKFYCTTCSISYFIKESFHFSRDGTHKLVRLKTSIKHSISHKPIHQFYWLDTEKQFIEKHCSNGSLINWRSLFPIKLGFSGNVWDQLGRKFTLSQPGFFTLNWRFFFKCSTFKSTHNEFISKEMTQSKI